MPMHTAEDLFVHELSNMYDAERQIADLLPKQAKQLKDGPLKDAFRRHEGETKKQIGNLEQCFKLMDRQPESSIAHAMRGLSHEHEMMVNQEPEPEVLALFEIGSGLKTEHFEIASYEHLIASARALGVSEVADLLQENLGQEREMEKKVRGMLEDAQQEKSG